MEQIAEIGQMILAALGAIVLISKTGEAVSYLFTPFTKIKESINTNQKTIKEHANCIETNTESINELKKFNKTLGASQLAMLNHFIDGNGVEGMKKVREELQSSLF